MLNIDTAGNLKLFGRTVADIEKYIDSESVRSMMTARLTAADLEAGEELPTTVVIRADRATPFKMVQRVISESRMLDTDNDLGAAWRNIQFTPPGSDCSLAIGKGFCHGLQLVVTDIEAAHEELVGRGLETSGIVHFEGGEQKPGRGDGPYNNFFFFLDPDGNNWAVQEK